MKVFRSLFLCSIVFLFFSCDLSSLFSDDSKDSKDEAIYITESDIPDSRFREALEECMEKSFGSITYVEAAALEELWIVGEDADVDDEDLSDWDLYDMDLTGLELFKGLKSLDLEILALAEDSDMELISNLPALEGLGFWFVDNIDYDVISGMTNLTSLTLDCLELSNISFLSGMTQLSDLSLEHNDITTLTALSQLSNLDYLWLNANPLDVSALSVISTYFPDLKALDFESNYSPEPLNLDTDLNDLIDMLDDLQSLVYLGMERTDMTDTHFSALYTNVLEPRKNEWIGLGLDGNSLTSASLSSIGELTNMEMLNIGENDNIDSISNLMNLTSLVELDLHDSNITNLDDLQTLYQNGAFSEAGMYLDEFYIDIEDCGLDLTTGSSDYDILMTLINAGIEVEYEEGNTTGAPEHLGTDYVTVSEVPDSQFRQVIEDELNMSFGEITFNDLETIDHLCIDTEDYSFSNFDFTGIEYLSELIILEYWDFTIANNDSIKQLSQLKNLEILSLGNFVLTNFDFLSDIPALDYLEMEDMALTDLGFLSGMTQLHILELDDNEISSISALSALSNLQYLDLSNNPIDLSDLSDISTYLPDLEGLGFSNSYTPAPFDLGTEFTSIINILDNLDQLVALDMDTFNMTDTQFNQLYTTVIQPKASEWITLHIGRSNLTNTSLTSISSLTNLESLAINENSSITSISAITGLTQLNELDLGESGLSNLADLEALYNNGAFSGENTEIIISELGLDLTTGSSDRIILDTLLNAGLYVEYENGNTL